MKQYSIEWTATPETGIGRKYTAATRYVADGFYIWKGRRYIDFNFYTADKWHLIRVSDGKCIHSATTAKQCKDALEYCMKKGYDINTMEKTGLSGDCKFNEDCTSFYW